MNHRRIGNRLALIAVFLIFTVLTVSAMRKAEGAKAAEPQEQANAQEAEPQISPESPAPSQDFTPIRRYLLLGSDSRSESERGRSDAILLVTILPEQKRILLTSILRDSWVEIPGCGWDRINCAYAVGGLEAAENVVSGILGVPIDGGAAMEFEAFRDAVDRIGGVTVNLTAEEASYLGLASDGYATLDGDLALTYARLRSVGHDDFDRTGRQRAILTSLFASCRGLPLKDKLTLASRLALSMDTDLAPRDWIEIASLDFSSYTIETLSLPEEERITFDTIDGKDVILFDPVRTSAALREAES